jgi:hypothetical protein
LTRSHGRRSRATTSAQRANKIAPRPSQPRQISPRPP